jgi:hypothetical protein
MKYTTEEAVENYTLTTIDDSFSGSIDEWISSMSKAMDRKCNRILVQPTASTIVFDGNGRTAITIPECCGITVVEVDEVDIFSKIKAYPTTIDSKNELKLESNYFTKGLQNISVTGKFGLHSAENVDAIDDVPDDIQFVCTVLVAGIVNNSNNQKDAVKSEKIGQYSVTYNDPAQRKDYMMAMDILKGYRRIAL